MRILHGTFLCVAKSKSVADAKASIIGSQGDRREPMMSVLKMLQGTLKPDEVLVAAKANTKEGPERKLALFYGFLYVGLYYDSIGEGEKASAALDSCLAHAGKDYMGRTPRFTKNNASLSPRQPSQLIQTPSKGTGLTGQPRKEHSSFCWPPGCHDQLKGQLNYEDSQSTSTHSGAVEGGRV